MHASRDELPVTFDAGGITFRGADWGEMRVTVNSFPAGLDATAFLTAFPESRCPCPHWGYVVKGRMQVTSSEGTDTYVAGELYYMPPGHTLFVEEDVELVEFSPAEQMAALGATLRHTFTETQSTRF